MRPVCELASQSINYPIQPLAMQGTLQNQEHPGAVFLCDQMVLILTSR